MNFCNLQVSITSQKKISNFSKHVSHIFICRICPKIKKKIKNDDVLKVCLGVPHIHISYVTDKAIKIFF